MQEILFRLKFGAVRGTPSSTGHRKGTPLPCPRCGNNIKHAELDYKLHGNQWVDHALHECTHHAHIAATEEIRATYAAALSTRLDVGQSAPKVTVRSLTMPLDHAAASLAGNQSGDGNAIQLDLRGFIQSDMPTLAKKLGLSQRDLVVTLNATQKGLQNVVRHLVDKTHSIPAADLAWPAR